MADQRFYQQFSTLLSYPRGDLAQIANDCLAEMRASQPAVAASFQPFADFLENNESSRVEEIYTATFDLQPHCHPYLGYQLCGESQQRTYFLLELKRLYRKYGFSGGNELPDHLGEVLAFLAVTEDETVQSELINDGLRPALDKLLKGFDNPQNPYRLLLGALQGYLDATSIPGQKEVAP